MIKTPDDTDLTTREYLEAAHAQQFQDTCMYAAQHYQKQMRQLGLPTTTVPNAVAVDTMREVTAKLRSVFGENVAFVLQVVGGPDFRCCATNTKAGSGLSCIDNTK